MNTNNPSSAGEYFNQHWARYRNAIDNNMLYHQEMMATLKQFLDTKFQNTSFSIVDIGCGDASKIAPVLKASKVTAYTGIDAAPEVLELAKASLAEIDCQKAWLAMNMVDGIYKISKPVDIIFTSYAVHHLTTDEKQQFIQACKDKLKPGGFLLFIDGVLEVNQSREAWLKKLSDRMKTADPSLSSQALEELMQHPSKDDFPETVKTYQVMATEQGWRGFELMLDRGIFCFMAFTK